MNQPVTVDFSPFRPHAKPSFSALKDTLTIIALIVIPMIPVILINLIIEAEDIAGLLGSISYALSLGGVGWLLYKSFMGRRKFQYDNGLALQAFANIHHLSYWTPPRDVPFDESSFVIKKLLRGYSVTIYGSYVIEGTLGTTPLLMTSAECLATPRIFGKTRLGFFTILRVPKRQTISHPKHVFVYEDDQFTYIATARVVSSQAEMRELFQIAGLV